MERCRGQADYGVCSLVLLSLCVYLEIRPWPYKHLVCPVRAPCCKSRQMEREHMAQMHLGGYQQLSSQNSTHTLALYVHGLQHVPEEESCI